MAAMIAVVIIILASILSAVFIVLPASEENNKSKNGQHGQLALFPTLSVNLEDSGSYDTLTFRHTGGDPIDWSDYKIIITDEDDNSVVQITCSLDESFIFGEVVVVDEELCPSFGDMNFRAGDTYTIEIYNIKENKLAFQLTRLSCELGEETASFPTIELTLKDEKSTVGEDTLTVKHTAGDPLDWSRYKIIITNQSDTSDTSVMISLEGYITAGESITFNSTTTGFANIDYQKTKSYMIEIYNIKENKRVWVKSNLICE
jgi:hypothetical protein